MENVSFVNEKQSGIQNMLQGFGISNCKKYVQIIIKSERRLEDLKNHLGDQTLKVGMSIGYNIDLFRNHFINSSEGKDILIDILTEANYVYLLSEIN